MGQKLHLETPPPKHLCFKFFQLLLLAVHFHSDSGITQLTKTVKDIAVLSCNYNISTEELTNVRVYWQKGHEVVQTVMPGKMQVSPKYKNRTIIDVTNNLSVVILALRLSDAGRYTCVIQKYEKGSYKVVHLTEVILVIRADFPVPNITDLGTQSTNIRRIICSTSGGFPKPHLSWLENGKELNATKATVSQDPETELYNISSELHFNVANNHNFTCSIKYGDLTVSQIFNWKTSEPQTSHSFHQSWIGMVILSLVVVIGIISVILYNCCPCQLNCCKMKRKKEEGESLLLSEKHWNIGIQDTESKLTMVYSLHKQFSFDCKAEPQTYYYFNQFWIWMVILSFLVVIGIILYCCRPN